VILGVGSTVNATPLLSTPLAVTTTFPVVAPVGTVATIDVALQLPIAVAAVPLNFTVLVPCVAPKFVPVIVTDAPTAPLVGDKLVILGEAAKDSPVLASKRLTARAIFVISRMAGSFSMVRSIRLASDRKH
jgi:hypothetical protein